jgi:hypothetical protein
MCVPDSSSSWHLSQMGSLISPNLKRCPFRWQCPVSSPTTQHNWSLFSFNRSFVLLAEGPCISPVKDSQYSLWITSVCQFRNIIGLVWFEVLLWIWQMFLRNIREILRGCTASNPRIYSSSFFLFKWEKDPTNSLPEAWSRNSYFN